MPSIAEKLFEFSADEQTWDYNLIGGNRIHQGIALYHVVPETCSQIIACGVTGVAYIVFNNGYMRTCKRYSTYEKAKAEFDRLRVPFDVRPEG